VNVQWFESLVHHAAAVHQQSAVDGRVVGVAMAGNCGMDCPVPQLVVNKRRGRRAKVVRARLPDAACPESPEARLGHIGVRVSVRVTRYTSSYRKSGRAVAVRRLVLIDAGLIRTSAGDLEIGHEIVRRSLPVNVDHRIRIASHERQGGLEVTRPRGQFSPGPAAHRDVMSKLYGRVQPEFALKINLRSPRAVCGDWHRETVAEGEER